MPHREPRDTGFPEPFCSQRNTTLPHPEADLSPNAWIGSKEVANPDLKRSHRSFVHRRTKHKKTLSHGIVAPSVASTASDMSIHVTTAEPTAQQQQQPQQLLASPSLLSVVETNTSQRQSREGRDSFLSARDAETPPTSPDQASIKSSKSILRKWRRK
ncbi:hypothetical protein K4F52_004141 [Lecanicillium sp. MT-2017a]|nr:hypothetical protein K4F52_004141 [Lecanicillium sp. MT-2017a]